jgi:hypothetical protein
MAGGPIGDRSRHFPASDALQTALDPSPVPKDRHRRSREVAR